MAIAVNFYGTLASAPTKPAMKKAPTLRLRKAKSACLKPLLSRLQMFVADVACRSERLYVKTF